MSGTTPFEIDVDDNTVSGARTFYIIVTADGGASQTFGPYTITISCAILTNTNIVISAPGSIVSVQEFIIGDTIAFVFSAFTSNYATSCPILKYELSDSSGVVTIPAGI